MEKKPISEKLKKAESKPRSKKRLIASPDLMDYIISHARSAIAVFDNDLKYIYVSKRYLNDYKIKEQSVIGKNHYEIFPDIPQRWKDAHQRSLAGEVLNSEEDPYHREDGSIDWTRWECCPWYESDGSIGGIIIYNEVINERKKIEEALRDSEERLQAILSAAPDPIVIYDYKGETEYLNPAFVEVFGWSLDELLGKRIPFVPDDQKQITSEKTKELFDSSNKVQFETKRLTKKGDSVDVIVSASCIKNREGGISQTVVILKDNTEQKQAEKELELLNYKFKHEATHDPLTKAPNRRAILDKLSRELIRAERKNSNLSIGVCDIDHFKHVNDEHGHLVGDDVLCDFVKVVQEALRPYDLVGRYGGEEFLLVIADSTGLADEKIYERVRAKVADHKMVTRSGEVSISISIGIAKNSRGDEKADEMLARADAALYRAKENGRNQLAFAD